MKKFVSLIYVLAGGTAGGLMVWLAQGHALRIWPDQITYADLIAVLLTGISVLVAILGLFLAVLAFWGYTQFRKMVRKAVEDITPGYLVTELKQGGSKQVLTDIVTGVVLEHAQRPEVVEQWAAQRAATLAQLDDVDRDE